MPGASVMGNVVIWKETVTKLLKVSALKMAGALILGNLVIWNKIVTKASISKGNAFSKYKLESSLSGVCR